MKQSDKRPVAPETFRSIHQWEYCSALLPRAADLSQFGRDGWECYAVIDAAADDAIFYFRRPK
jgi:hypothetical protein